MIFFTTIKKMGIRIFDSNNRSLGTIFGCMGGFALGLTAVLSQKANLPILGIPESIAYKIIAVCLSTGIGGNLASYIGASIDILTNEKTVFDLVEYCLVHWGCMNPRQPPVQALDVEQVEEHKKHFPFITSAVPKEKGVEERRLDDLEMARPSLQGIPINIIRLFIDKLNEIHSQLQNLNQTEQIRKESPRLRHLSLSIEEPIESTTETVNRKFEAIAEQLRNLVRNQAHQLEIIDSLKEENRMLKQALRETQDKNGQLAESIMRRHQSDNTSDSQRGATPY